MIVLFLAEQKRKRLKEKQQYVVCSHEGTKIEFECDSLAFAGDSGSEEPQSMSSSWVTTEAEHSSQHAIYESISP